MLKNDIIRLRHIFDAANQAVKFCSGRSRDDLDTDDMLSLSLIRLLEIIGESAKAVSIEYRESHPEISWRKMSGMRDKLIHQYYDVNLDIVWETVTDDLPPLIKQLGNILI
jgi:uncharacterized protein with HEPN domain